MTHPLEEATAIGVLPLAAGGYTSDGDAYTLGGVSRPAPEGKPVLESLDPPQFQIGSPSVALQCHGSGFDQDCFVAFAGHAERTDFHDDTTVSTFIDSDVWKGADTVQVSVVSPDRGGSQSVDFQIVDG